MNKWCVPSKVLKEAIVPDFSVKLLVITPEFRVQTLCALAKILHRTK